MPDIESDLIHNSAIVVTLISDLQSSDVATWMKAFSKLEGLEPSTANFIVQKADGVYPGLEEFGKDLIQCAKDGEFNPVSVEDEVIERALLIMKRRRKRSPLILDDDPDVRKSTVEAIG